MSALRRRTWLAVLGAIALAAVLAIACTRGSEDASPPVDAELVAFLSEARSLHHIANVKEESGDLAGAAGAMERLVGAQPPHPGKPTPEVEEVLADAYARLAELRLKHGEVDAAAKAIASGLVHAPEPTYFKGHLLEVQGVVEESRAAELTDAGQSEAARATRERAINLLEQAVKIQEQVIQRSLGKEGGR